MTTEQKAIPHYETPEMEVVEMSTEQAILQKASNICFGGYIYINQHIMENSNYIVPKVEIIDIQVQGVLAESLVKDQTGEWD